MRKLFGSVFLLLIVSFIAVLPLYASSATDESVLGNDRWSVDSSGNLVPIADASYTIGNASYRPSTGIFSGALTFQGNILAAGIANGDSTSMTSAETAVSVTYKRVRKILGETVGQVNTLANGDPGQILTIEVYRVQESMSGTMILIPATRTGFYSLTFDAAGDFATLIYLSDTLGWTIQALNSVTANSIQ